MEATLLPTDDALRGIADTRLYWVLRSPVPLAGMPYPDDCPWSSLAAAGFRDVVSLADPEPAYDPFPLVGHCNYLEDLWGGRVPTDPNKEALLVEQAVRRVRLLLAEGHGTVVHCVGGRGRTGTVIGGVLVSLGHDPVDVEEWLCRLHQARGKADGWPESRWQSAMLQRFRACG